MAYFAAIRAIPDSTRDAVIEKWMTYCKSDQLNEFMLWRLHVMK